MKLKEFVLIKCDRNINSDDVCNLVKFDIDGQIDDVILSPFHRISVISGVYG